MAAEETPELASAEQELQLDEAAWNDLFLGVVDECGGPEDHLPLLRSPRSPMAAEAFEPASAEQELELDEAAWNDLFLGLVEECGGPEDHLPLVRSPRSPIAAEEALEPASAEQELELDEAAWNDHLHLVQSPRSAMAAEEAPEPARVEVEEKKEGKKKCRGQKSKGKENERKRREQYSELYSKLRAMVPNVSPTEPREKLINGTICYIKELEQCAKDLEAQKEKKRKAAATTTHPISSVNVTHTGKTLFFGIQTKAIPGLASGILQVFDASNTKVQVLAASASCKDLTLTVTITVLLRSGDAGVAEQTIGQLKAHLWDCLP